jgi:thermitase
VVVAAAGNRGRDVKDYPAAYANAMAVSATNSGDRLASYSSYGGWVDVAAPGTSILSTKLGGGYKTMSGTSMAAPHVAGLAGLLAAQGRTASEIRSRIENTARDLGPDGKDRYYGHGRINAYRAVGG